MLQAFGPALMATIVLQRSFRASLGTAGARFSKLSYSRRWASTKSIFKSYLVAPQELANVLQDQKTASASSRVIPLCAAWFLPNDEHKRTGHKVFEERRVPDARFFDIDDIKDHDSSYPHMLPTAEGFAESMSKLGLKRDDHLVVYDSYEQGIFSAPRVASVKSRCTIHRYTNTFQLYAQSLRSQSSTHSQQFQSVGRSGIPNRRWKANSRAMGEEYLPRSEHQPGSGSLLQGCEVHCPRVLNGGFRENTNN